MGVPSLSHGFSSPLSQPVRFGLAAVVLFWVGCDQNPPVPDPIPPTYVDVLQVPDGWTLPEFP